MKLTSSDIIIFNEKQQIKQTLLKEYGSLEAAADKLGLYCDTLQNYLRGSIKLPDKFKAKLCLTLNKGYDEIVISPEQQIMSYISSIVDYPYLYDSHNDLETFEKIRNICVELKFYDGIGKAYFIIGTLYYKLGNIDLAFKYYNDAIEILELNSKSYNVLIEVTSRIAFQAYKQQNISFAGSYFDKAELQMSKYKENIDYKSLFYFYYYKGVYLQELKELDLSRDYLYKASELAANSRWKAATVCLIGLSYKRQGEYKKAIEIYNESLSMVGDGNYPTKSSICNNIAEAYRAYGKLDEASYYIDKAFEYLGDTNDEARRINFFHTYACINVDKGEYTKNFENLISYITQNNNYIIDKEYIIQAITLLTKLAEMRNDQVEFNKIKEVIISLIKEYDNDMNTMFLHNLKACLGDIVLKTN
jgi:tetratricopeptide (TPR) repeat protein